MLLSTYNDTKIKFFKKYNDGTGQSYSNILNRPRDYLTTEEMISWDKTGPMDPTDGARWKQYGNYGHNTGGAWYGYPINQKNYLIEKRKSLIGGGWMTLPMTGYMHGWKYDWNKRAGKWSGSDTGYSNYDGTTGPAFSEDNTPKTGGILSPSKNYIEGNGDRGKERQKDRKAWKGTLSLLEYVSDLYNSLRTEAGNQNYASNFDKALGVDKSSGQEQVKRKALSKKLTKLYPQGSGLCLYINFLNAADANPQKLGFWKRATKMGWTPLLYAAAASNVMYYHDYIATQDSAFHTTSNQFENIANGQARDSKKTKSNAIPIYRRKANMVKDVVNGVTEFKTHGDDTKFEFSIHKLSKNLNNEISDLKNRKKAYFEGVSKRRQLTEKDYNELNSNIKKFGINGEGSDEEGMFDTFKSFVDKAFKNTFFLPISDNANSLEKCQDPEGKGKGRVYNEDSSTSSYYFPGCGENKCCGVATNYDVLNEVSSGNNPLKMYQPAPWMIKGAYTNAKPDNNNYEKTPLNECPVGTKKIETSEECLMAAKYLGYNMMSKASGVSRTPGLWLSNEFEKTIPSGCTITTKKRVNNNNEDGHLAHWQPIDGGDGNARGDLIPLCKVDTSSCELDRLSGVVFSRNKPEYADKEFPGCGESSCCLQVGTFTKNNKDYTVDTNKTKPNFCFPMEKGENDDTGKIYGIDEIVQKINANPPLNNELLNKVTESDIMGADPNVRNEMKKYGMHFSFNMGELTGNQCKQDGTENSACSLSYKLYQPSEGDYKCDLSLCVQDSNIKDIKKQKCFFGKGAKTNCDSAARIKKLEYEASKSSKVVCTTSAPTVDDSNVLVDELKKKLADLQQNQKDYEQKLKDAEDALNNANKKLEENPDDADAIAAAAAAAEAKRIADEEAKRLADEEAKTAKEKENAEKNRLDQIINDISKHSKQQDERWKRWDEHAAASSCNTGNCGPTTSNQLDELKKQLDDLKKEETCALEGFGNRKHTRNIVEGFVGFSSFGRSTIVEGNTNKPTPTTLAPMTETPTTLAPMTERPTTLAPMTERPTTLAPMTETITKNIKKQNNTTLAPETNDMSEPGPLEQAGSTFGKAADELFSDEKFLNSINMNGNKNSQGGKTEADTEKEKHNMGNNNGPGSSQYNGSGVTVICENSNGGAPSYSRQSTDVNEIFTNSGLIGNGGSESGPASVPKSVTTLPPTTAPKTNPGAADTILDTFANMGRNTRFFVG